MVRLKNRYLLLEILYPSSTPGQLPKPTTPATTGTPTQADHQHDHLKFHAPTSDTLTPGYLAKIIRDEVADLFGDWGVGRLGGGGISGELPPPVPSGYFNRIGIILIYVKSNISPPQPQQQSSEFRAHLFDSFGLL